MSAQSIPMGRWVRVTKAQPCPICQRQDWCSIGAKYVHCMRIASEKPCDSAGGWFHAIEGDRPKVVPVREEVKCVNLLPLYSKWKSQTEDRHLEQLSQLLGVDELPLRALQVAWAEEHDAWAFPMVNAEREITGIRLRNERGEKWAVRGGKNGVFLSQSLVPPSRRAYICEGPTDTAALLSIGLFAVGRPSCNEGSKILTDLLPKLGVREAVIVADHDRDKAAPDGRAFNPGVDGAANLSQRLPMRTCIWLPASKDARDFVRNGGTALVLENALKSVRWKVAQ